MKKLLYLLLCVYCLSCQQKPSEIDQKLLQEQAEFFHDKENSNEILIKTMHSHIESRGNHPWDRSLFENMWKQHQLFLKITANFSNKDSLQFLFSLYQKQAEKTNSIWLKNSNKVDYDIEKHQNLFNEMMKNSSFQKTELFKNTFHKNHHILLKNCYSSIQYKCWFCFSFIKLNLNAKEYTHGDTISGKFFFVNGIYETPLFPKININGKLQSTFFKYSQIIDSTQKPIININVSYLKNLTKDTTFNTFVHYKIKK